jgi:hypothetical protein
LKVPLLLFLACLLVYNANLRQIGSGDTLPARYLPLILLRDGTLHLDANARLVAHGHSTIAAWNRPDGIDGKVTYFEPWAYWMIYTREHQLTSLYPVVTSVIVSPLYIPSVIWLNVRGWEQPQIDRIAEFMEKLSASILASLATVLMYLIFQREGSRWSLPMAVVFAFGTNTWMISSQALWQHGTGELLIALALLLVVSSPSPMRTALLGAVCVLMAANRPPDALIAGAIILFIIWSRGRTAAWLLAGAAIPLAALLYYNINFIGHIAGAYALAKPYKFFTLNLSGVAGLLVSPTRGLFVFSPFLLFLPVGLIQRLRTPGSKGLVFVLGFAVIAQILVYSQADWRAGVSWGPRWLTNLLPILVWMLAPAPLVLRRPVRDVFILLMLTSIGVQSIGAFWYTKTSDERIFAGDSTSMNAAWDLQNIPFLVELSHPPAKGELQCAARGAIDRVGSMLFSNPEQIPQLETGEVFKGWALTCGRTPAQVLLLVDGIVIGATTNFLTRVEVNEGVRTTSLSSWRISVNMLGVSEGERVLQLAVRVEPRSDIRIIREQRIFVVAQEPVQLASSLPAEPSSPTELEAMAKHVATSLQERQDTEGYWLTSYTGGLVYESAQEEMNTFLTSMMVDLLSPVAHQQGLDEVMERAELHLAAQIESSGLVRYHGLPDSPLIGTLGCVITPDSDDTALVWRIVGPDKNDPREQSMLEELARYRDVRGLYRTWLAPQDQYQCIDPGNDPNPTDIAIQMHMYLMLHEFDQPAADDLCKALQTSFRDGDLWVYYSKAPLVPYLRAAELQKLGCNIPLPVDRLALPVAGQEIWSEAIRLLIESMASPQNDNTQEDIQNLLARIGNNDFALLDQAPPLIYHNDLTASVRRYYWSRDFGYALWLRLYQIAGVESGSLQQTLP